MICVAFLKFGFISFPLVAELPSLLLQPCILVLRLRCALLPCFMPLMKMTASNIITALDISLMAFSSISAGAVCVGAGAGRPWQGTMQEPNEGWLQLSGQRPQQLQDQAVPLGSSAQAVPLRDVQNTVELRCAFTSSC